MQANPFGQQMLTTLGNQSGYHFVFVVLPTIYTDDGGGTVLNASGKPVTSADLGPCPNGQKLKQGTYYIVVDPGFAKKSKLDVIGAHEVGHSLQDILFPGSPNRQLGGPLNEQSVINNWENPYRQAESPPLPPRSGHGGL
jgi:hypothetical protein